MAASSTSNGLLQSPAGGLGEALRLQPDDLPVPVRADILAGMYDRQALIHS